MLALIRGAGDLATGIALRLWRSGIRVVLTDLERPTAIRRTVAFSEAIVHGETTVEDVTARLAANADEARALLAKTNLTGTPFSAQLPAAQLHWLLADKDECVTIESAADGLHVYDNPAGVLTNNPPFPQQLFRLNDYQSLSPRQPENTFAPSLDLRSYSRGMGALGLPGDLSSPSRFVRAAFTRANSVSGRSETESVSQFFHILGAVEQVRGCCEVAPGKHEITIYTSCCSAQRGIYYYTTYENRRICAVDMHRCDLDAAALVRFAPRTEEDIFFQR